MTDSDTDQLLEVRDAAALSQLVGEPARPALILFDAPWCGPCRRLAEALSRLAARSLVTLARLDVDRLPGEARRYGVTGVPTLLLFRSGQIAARRLGEVEEADLRDWLAAECLG